ncbi:transmembrane protein 106B-like [Polyodon spathula]|uniref:transmembrane protein 106B-like n=1 Tax=Polyodon spathula TaxID=7913 RepID=UPI001B7DD995|nr:transmembrane protein 106B-like [Polyodon spathula]
MGGSIATLAKSEDLEPGEQDDKSAVLPPKKKSSGTNYQSINGTVSSSYLDKVGRSNMNCPSCQGTGRIPRDQEEHLVALIPYSDQRLKPSRTKLYVCVSVIICLLASALVIFFVFPRTITVTAVGIKSVFVWYPQDAVSMNITNIVEITNDNFYSIHVSSLSLQVMWYETMVGKVKSENITVVKPLSKSQFNYTVGIQVNDPGIHKYCTMSSIKIHTMFFHIQGSVNVLYMARTEQLSLDAYEFVDCGANTTTPYSFNRPGSEQ